MTDHELVLKRKSSLGLLNPSEIVAGVYDSDEFLCTWANGIAT